MFACKVDGQEEYQKKEMKQSISWERILNAGMVHVITALEQCLPCQLGMQVWLWTTEAINHAWNGAKDVPEKGAEA